MKKNIFKLIGILAITLIVYAMSDANVAKAADKNLYFKVTQNGSTIYRDLDSDGKKEKLTLNHKVTGEYDDIYNFTFNINDKTVWKCKKYNDSDMAERWSAGVVDMRDYDGTWKVELDGTLYSYKGGKLVAVQLPKQLSSIYGGTYIEDYKGYTKGYCETSILTHKLNLSFMCDSWTTEPVKLYLKNNKFSLKNKFTVNINSNFFEGHLSRKVTLYSKRSAKAANKVCTLSTGKHVYATKAFVESAKKVTIDNKSYKILTTTWIYLTDKNGHSGWYKPELDFKSAYNPNDITYCYKNIFSDGKFAG